MQIFENVRTIRSLICLKQETVASLLGISQNAYSRMERGKIKITGSRKKELAKIFGVTEEMIDNFHLSPILVRDNEHDLQFGIKKIVPTEDYFIETLNSLQNENLNLKKINSDLLKENNLIKHKIVISSR